MSAGDDDHDDDAQLKQLRAVWVTMRDEDPPDRGLAALMTAAREKATELEEAARPSWWQRVVATLRRPQVLALATVTLLLGGALVVTQRSARMKAESVAMPETADRNLMMSDAVQPKGGYAEPSGASAASAGSGATVAPMDQEEAKPAEVAVEAPPKLRTSKPGSKAKPSPSPDPMNVHEAAAEPRSTTPAGPRGLVGGGTAPSLSIAQDDAPVAADSAPRNEAATVQPAPKKPIARTPPPEIEGEDRVSKDNTKAPATIDQLVKQCESAAVRRDCAAVRVIAQKILTSSPSTYKTRVANNSAIQKCLPESASNAAAVE